jgi:2-amino-4-hydroxy-6-hydroxymethyldihydropteridine diphosphokinase
MPERHVLLSLGSNIEPREHRLAAAIEALQQSGLVSRVAVSNVYSTEPVGVTDQAVFLNCCLAGITAIEPATLVANIKKLEHHLGRQHRLRWHEREIDIDVLLVDDVILDSPVATIPHPRMHERRFVLVPACDVAATMIHPILHASIDALCQACADTAAVELLGPLSV